MKIQITRKPIHPHAGMRKQALHTLTLAALLFTFLLPPRLHSQTEPSALMELQSTDKGFLLPRMTQEQRDAIQSPASGLMIFNTTSFCLEINLGSPSVPLWWPNGCRGSISTLGCAGAIASGMIQSGFPVSGLVSVPYTGGNGGPHPGQTVSSVEVTGLTATLAAGSFANGSGNLAYVISGTSNATGVASFTLDIGGQSCTYNLIMASCGAYIAPNVWKGFMCHNLGAANTAANPFTPSWEINGGYWQWGRAAMAAPGPTGPGAGEAKDGLISGWNTQYAPNGAWSDATKTANDPCPQGFRVPTKAQWDGVRNYNTQSITGTWNSSPTNYSSGRYFGPGLMLPAAGARDDFNGELFLRGSDGGYWSGAEDGTNFAWGLLFDSGSAGTYDLINRRYGQSLRCIAQ